MFFPSATLILLLMRSGALARPEGGDVGGVGPGPGRRSLALRAAPDNPSGAYKPARVQCGSETPVIRGASTISPQESVWLTARKEKVAPLMRAFLNNSNMTGFDVDAFFDSVTKQQAAQPNVGIALSGGGYRALLNAAGFIAAADSRTPGSMDPGGIGGLLQISTYLAGLSGGGWMVGSLYANNFSTVPQLQRGSNGSNVWKFDRSIVKGPESQGISILKTADYYSDIAAQVAAKSDAGFETTITDYWGRALSYQLLNVTDGGPAYTFSSIADSDAFADGHQPMPILVADGRTPGQKVISLNVTVYEFNPWEMGSFDPSVFGFAPLRYLGSNFSQGRLVNKSECVRGFDQLGFIMGTSSSLFNQFMLQNLSESGVPGVLLDPVERVFNKLGKANNDIAQYKPNPFLNYNALTNDNANQAELDLVDGGEDLQNIPLHPLIQPERGLDVIFSIDSSADTAYTWPNGTALRASYDRSRERIANGTGFPAVPDAETFINLGLNRRPTFFGCDVKNFTSSTVPPLIVYMANTPYSAMSNVTTLTMEYPSKQRDGMIENGYNVATMGNGTLQADWRTCLACAIMQRTWARTGDAAAVPAVCRSCFDRHCWNGTRDSRNASAFEPLPFLGLDPSTSTSTSAGAGPSWDWPAVVAGLAAYAVFA